MEKQDFIDNRLVRFSYVAMFFLLVLGIANITIKNNLVTGYVDLSVALLLFINLKMKYPNSKKISYSLFMAILLYTYMLYDTNVFLTGWLWSLTFPAIAFLVNVKQKALYWTLLFGATLLAVLLIQYYLDIDSAYTNYQLIKLIIVYMLNSYLIYTFATEVEFYTDKLKELNNSLENIVEKEVEKNRQKDQQMIQQSRLAQMGEMISMIAHQWRQPLSAISSASAAINIKSKFEELDDTTAQKLSSDISNYTQHLSSTIDDFRNFFKENKEKNIITFEKIIHSVLSIVGLSIKNQGINLIQSLNSTKEFFTYPNEIKQVVLNIIKNAEDVLIDREIKNPKITIETFSNVLIVRDNGGGISEQNIDKIFDPYFSTKLKKDGTGLGLYMSKTIIEKHCNGKLSVSNDDEGAVFLIELD